MTAQTTSGTLARKPGAMSRLSGWRCQRVESDSCRRTVDRGNGYHPWRKQEPSSHFHRVTPCHAVPNPTLGTGRRALHAPSPKAHGPLGQPFGNPAVTGGIGTLAHAPPDRTVPFASLNVDKKGS